MHAPEILRPHLARPVAILGGGASGQGARALAAALGGKSAIYDRQGAEFTALAARGHSLVVYSPGIPPDHPWLARARDAGCTTLGELDFAALCWTGRIVAITGTNGKTTLTEFVVHALAAAGCRAVAAGNIGLAFSRAVAERGGGTPATTAVCEVSSFQAETLEHFRAEATLWTNFAEDHLERHRSLESYFAAKARLASRSGAVFAGSSVRAFAGRAGASCGTGAWGSVTWVETEGQGEDPRLDGTVFAAYPQRENFLLAASWWRAGGRDPGLLHAAAAAFRLGRHRLARVAEIGGIGFWNDSKATNFHAVEAALARFDEPVVLIAGGRAKGGDIGGFVRRIAPRVRHCCLMGETAAEMAEHCTAVGIPHSLCATLGEAVSRSIEAARPGDNVLLSPGFASFDMFRSYEDRGNQFERALNLNPADHSVLSSHP